jgi:hypothetical protein
MKILWLMSGDFRDLCLFFDLKYKICISVYRARLLDDQLIYAPDRGYVSFTLPFFANFIRWYKENHLI